MKRKTSFKVIGLSTLGLLFAMQANAFEIVQIESHNQKDLHLDAGVAGIARSANKAERNIIFKQQKFNLKLLNEEADKTGTKHLRYSQTYQGIPIWGRQVIQHKKNSSRSFFGPSPEDNKFTGELIKDLNQDLPNLKRPIDFSESDALNLAKDLHKQQNHIDAATSLLYENEMSELVVYTYADDGTPKLAYSVSFFVDDKDGNKPARPSYLIDAQNKQVIKTWNKLMHVKLGTGPGGNEKTGKYLYGGTGPNDRDKLEIREAQHGECFMTNNKVRTVNLNKGYYGAKTYHFPCYDNADDSVNGAFSPMNDAHHYGEKIYDMYNDWYHQAPLKFKLIMRVHYGRSYENAFWNGSSMTFGDGRDYFYPLVSMDVAAHEISHGVTEQNSGLEYYGQSGGMNESFSDMAGKAGEFYAFGQNNWGLGHEIMKSTDPLRYLDTPEKDGDSIGDARDYNDALDVHNSSGVFNKAFYLLSTHGAWNIRKAFDVFFHANKYYWTPNSTFTEGALGAIYSAEDLGYEMTDVINIFKQVGIECTAESCAIMAENRPGKMQVD